MTDSEKLRSLADWFDARDQGVPNGNEVRRDLRRIASYLERPTSREALLDKISLEREGVHFSQIEMYKGRAEVLSAAFDLALADLNRLDRRLDEILEKLK